MYCLRTGRPLRTTSEGETYELTRAHSRKLSIRKQRIERKRCDQLTGARCSKQAAARYPQRSRCPTTRSQLCGQARTKDCEPIGGKAKRADQLVSVASAHSLRVQEVMSRKMIRKMKEQTRAEFEQLRELVHAHFRRINHSRCASATNPREMAAIRCNSHHRALPWSRRT